MRANAVISIISALFNLLFRGTVKCSETRTFFIQEPLPAILRNNTTRMKNFQEQIKQFFAKTNKEILDYLLQWWEMDSVSENGTIRLIGTYEKAEKPDKNGNEYGFFVNVRSQKGDILYYPFRLGQVRIYSTHKEHYQNTEFLQLEVSLSKQQFREKIKVTIYHPT